MFRRLWQVLVIFALANLSALGQQQQVLILHDGNSPSAWIGAMHAKMLANLLRHFQLGSEIATVNDYQRGAVSNYRATFYLGTVYNNPLPSRFLQDTLSTTNPVCWFKYNLWQLSSAPAYSNQFKARFGFQFNYMDDS